ncbi:MAG: NADPH-dependent 7-cyano-7-deazaguanine reductase QueF, partial [Betaproteobacteria bacterium]|nr:NADPH-dependent 7-cyano-7-deazaguanine reductase QueF [Betaproteobacteria bacterium]
MTDNPLGSHTEHPPKYQPDVLYPIPRWASRSLLDIDKKIRMFGLDHWQAYELSWLNNSGKPQVAIAEFYFNSESENIVESKSLKLYLNSLNQERYKNRETVRSLIEKDLSLVSLSEVKVVIHPLDEIGNEAFSARPGRCIDYSDVELGARQPDAELLNITDLDR